MKTLVGTGSLARLILRQDRVRLPVWIAVLTLVPVASAGAIAGLYPTEAARQELTVTVASNPALVAFLGPVFGSSIGALTAWRTGTLGTLLAGLMAVLTMVRHTRDEEESGRRELIGATVVGRHAPLCAAFLVTAGAGVVVGALLTAGLLANGLPVAGSMAFGMGFAAVSAAFAGIGAAAAQLTAGSGAARGIGIGAVGVAYVLRFAGDAGAASGWSWLSWLSPIGWFSQSRPFAGERWWALGLWLALACAAMSAAYLISSRRDLGAGALASRSGSPRAASTLDGAHALAWRLNRASLAGWSAGLAVLGLIYGSVADSIGELLDDNPALIEAFQLIGGSQAITDAYLGAATGVLAMISAAYAISAVLRLQVEETSLRAEHILATATPRLRWATSHLLYGIFGPVLMLTLAGVVTGVALGAVTGDIAGEALRVLGAALVQVPAVWVLTGVAMVLYGVMPRLTAASWGALLAFMLLGQLGQILQLPQWALNLSPFTHIQALPADQIDLLALAALGLVAAALVAVGLAGFRRRDLHPG